METVTVYKSSLEELREALNSKGHELAVLRGRLLGLADFCDSHPELVAQQIKEMAAEIDSGVDISLV